MNRKLSIILLILCFGNIFAAAQENSENNKPTGLALEVTSLKGRPPGYITIGETLPKTNWAWYGAFGRIAGFQTSAERLPVQAVKFIPYLDNNLIRVKVRVFTGQKSFEKEETVTELSMRENERVFVKELANYGVEPFEIAVVRVVPAVSTALPSVENKTVSLQVTGIEPNFSTLPTYKLSVTNNSNKPVSAFTFETIVEERNRLSGMPQGQHGEYLIEPGATYAKELRIPLEYKKPVEGEIPKPASKPTIVISSVIFADGSYEGDAFRAAQYRAYTLGRRSQVKQIIALIESNETNFSQFSFNRFAEQSAKLTTNTDESEFGTLVKQFPALNENQKAYLREGVEGASDDIKKEFISGTKRYQSDLESNAARAYLKGLKEQYQKWLVRLQ